MYHFVLPARRTGKSYLADAVATSILGPVTPAAYLRLRREAAGVSIDDLARALVTIADHRRPHPRKPLPLRVMTARFVEGRDLIRMLETPGTTARQDVTLNAIASLIPFDPAVYRQLATGPVDRHPRICRGCGCSGHDACSTEHAVCRWITPGLCSFCDEGGARAVQPAQARAA